MIINLIFLNFSIFFLTQQIQNGTIRMVKYDELDFITWNMQKMLFNYITHRFTVQNLYYKSHQNTFKYCTKYCWYKEPRSTYKCVLIIRPDELKMAPFYSWWGSVCAPRRCCFGCIHTSKSLVSLIDCRLWAWPVQNFLF